MGDPTTRAPLLHHPPQPPIKSGQQGLIKSGQQGLAGVGKTTAVLGSIVTTLVCIFLSYLGVMFLLEKNTGIQFIDKWIDENAANSDKWVKTTGVERRLQR